MNATARYWKAAAFTRWLLPAVCFFLVLSLTAPQFNGDTLRYAPEVMSYHENTFTPGNNPLWEFGHVMWRPALYALFRVCGPAVESLRKEGALDSLLWLMYAVNIAAGLGAFLLLRSLLERVATAKLALLLAVSFLCTNAVINYVQSGTPYLPGLFFLLLSLWLVQRAVTGRHPTACALAAGCAMAASVAIWLPYVLSLLAVLLFGFLWQRKSLEIRSPEAVQRLRMAIATATVCVILTAVFYAVAIQARGIHSAAGFRRWVESAGNDWKQTQKWKRAVSGIPRSFLYLGDDTLLLKRYVLRDPYVQVRWRDLVTGGLLKIVLFYGFAAVLAANLWRRKQDRWAALCLLTSAVPLAWFAIVVFEPGSPERYLPAYPFLFLAAAAVLGSLRWRSWSWLVIAGFLGPVLCTVDIRAMARPPQEAELRNFLARKAVIDGRMPPGSLLAVPLMSDEFSRLPHLWPLNARARVTKYRVHYVMDPATAHAPYWREEFGSRALAVWQSGREVWLSKHLLAGRPRPEWRWVEGDGPSPWKNIPAFFDRFEAQEMVAGPDGFVRIPDSPANRAILAGLNPPPAAP